MMIIWCMVPEISGTTDFFFFISGYFLPFYHPPLTTQKIKILEKWKKLLEVLLLILNMSTINENYMMYAVWDTEHERQIFFSFWTIFCPFTPHSPPLITQRIKIFKKWKKKKKKPGDIIILHKCTINDNHMIYGSWDMKCTRQTFFLILAICHFLPFYLPNNLKNEISKKWKKRLEISSFYTSVPKIMIIGYTVPEIWQVTDVIVIFHFGQFFAPLTTSS